MSLVGEPVEKATPMGWVVLLLALIVSITAVWLLSELPILTAAYAGGLATLMALLIVLRNKAGHSSFMGRIGVSVQQADNDRFDILILQQLCDIPDLFFIERFQHLSLRVQTFGDLETAPSRYQGKRLVAKHVVQARPDLAPDFQHIAKTFGDQQRCLCALTFDNGVGRDGCSMNQMDAIVGSRLLFLQAAMQNL